MTEAEERELASMPSLKEMNAQFHPSEQFQKKMDRLLKKAHRKEGWVQIWKPTKKMLIAFTSVMTALTFALLPVQAVQDLSLCALSKFKQTSLKKDENSLYDLGFPYRRFRPGTRNTFLQRISFQAHLCAWNILQALHPCSGEVHVPVAPSLCSGVFLAYTPV